EGTSGRKQRLGCSSWRLRNSGGRQDFIIATYQIQSCNTSRQTPGKSTQPFDVLLGVLDAFTRLRNKNVFRGTYGSDAILPKILKEFILSAIFETREEGSAVRATAIS